MKEQTAQRFHVPKELFTDLPKITWIGLHDVTIENCGGILLCEENRIQFSCKAGILSLTGQSLVILEIADGIAVLSGTISAISYD